MDLEKQQRKGVHADFSEGMVGSVDGSFITVMTTFHLVIWSDGSLGLGIWTLFDEYFILPFLLFASNIQRKP